MTDAEREALVERMAEALYDYPPDNNWACAVSDSKRWWRGMASRVLAVAEPVVRAELEELREELSRLRLEMGEAHARAALGAKP